MRRVQKLKIVPPNKEIQDSCIEVAKRLLDRAKKGEIFSIVAVCDMPGKDVYQIASMHDDNLIMIGKLEVCKDLLLDQISGKI